MVCGVLSLSRHVAPLVFGLLARPPCGTSGDAVSRDALLAHVHATYPHAASSGVEQVVRVLLQQGDICVGAAANTYVCSNPAVASGAEQLHFPNDASMGWN